MQIWNDLKTSVTSYDTGVYREIAYRIATLSNWLIAIKAVESDVLPLAKLKIRNKASEGGVGNYTRSVAGSSIVKD